MNTNLPLFENLALSRPEETNYIQAFRNLYYHLYTSSESSRAERIFEDIAKLLLIKVLVDRSTGLDALQKFMDGDDSANKILLPILVDRFPRLISEGDLFSIGDDAVRKGLTDLACINLTQAPASILGEAFQAIIGPRLRGEKGQFFTPKAVVQAMVRVARPGPEDKIVDPAAGTGSFLVGAHFFRKENNPRFQKFGPMVGLEKDKDLYRLGGAMVNIATDSIGCIHLVNSLDLDALAKIQEPNPFDADIVLTNPPFGAKIGVSDERILSKFSLGHGWGFSLTENLWYELPDVRRTQDPQLLFLDLCIHLLKPGGLLGIILPEGVFGNRKNGYVWDFVRSKGEIEAIIDCPRTTFQPSTDTKTNILFVRKQAKKVVALPEPLIAVAKTCGHDRRGKQLTPRGEAILNDLEEIGIAYGREDSKWWARCKITDKYYLVPRFYHNEAKNAVASIAKEWGGEVVTIGELVKSGYLHIRKGREVGADAYGTGNIPFVRTSDISNWEISMDPTNGVSEKIYKKYRALQDLKPYDILLVVDGRYKIGRTAILQPQNCKCVIQSHFRIITAAANSPVNSYELLYLLNLPSVIDEIRNLVFIQSTLGAIGKRLGILQLPLPKKTHQWNQKIKVFRATIEGRARLLAKLKEFETPQSEI